MTDQRTRQQQLGFTAVLMIVLAVVGVVQLVGAGIAASEGRNYLWPLLGGLLMLVISGFNARAWLRGKRAP